MASLTLPTRYKIWEILVEERHFKALRNNHLNPRRFNGRRGQRHLEHTIVKDCPLSLQPIASTVKLVRTNSGESWY
ncbi:MAG: hypothetical protein F6K58_21090 [Symploca sp. SIO2E9]|nr:hypothetical protein [Symploca sp. SIO2E9]